jgi:hypothetical protein
MPPMLVHGLMRERQRRRRAEHAPGGPPWAARRWPPWLSRGWCTRQAAGSTPVPVRHLAVVQALSVLLVLRAFASGSTAMTGIEAISNAVPSFKPVE